MSTTTQRDRVLAILDDCRWHSTGEFLDEGITRAAARVLELRRAGHVIEARRRGSGFCEYRLVRRAGGMKGAITPPPAPTQLPLDATCFECEAPAADIASGQWWCAEHLEREIER